MTCPHCESWVATSRAHLDRRAARLRLGGDIKPCRKCGTRDWATTDAKIKDRAKSRERKRTRGLLVGAFIILMIVVVYALSR